MEDLFRSFWWLLFPLGWVAFAGIRSLLDYRRQRDALDLLRTYAEKGQEPPEALLSILERATEPADDDWSGRSASRPPQARHYWSLFGLFAVLALGFGVAGWSSGFSGAGWPFGVVALTMGAVGLWALINALLLQRKP